MIEQARQVLRDNDQGGYTVPTASLYPFQWNWDAGITALGWATFDEPRAWRELDLLFRGQWDSGMVPHIVFHVPTEGYFPAPADWGVAHSPPTSSITQPPLLATIARLLYEGAKVRAAARSRLLILLPRLIEYHRYFYRERDPEGTGLVASYHPWESGMDNSPAWDQALARVPSSTRSYQRSDLQHLDSKERPLKQEYDRYLYLMEQSKALKFDCAAIHASSPYKVQDVGLNAILLRANDDLQYLCGELDVQADISDLTRYGERARGAISRLWSEDLGCFLSRDLITGELIPIRTTAGLMPLYAFSATPQQADRLVDRLDSWLDTAPLGVASTHPGEAQFDPRRYWRGPSWVHINWMIAQGLEHYGHSDYARRLRENSRTLIKSAGFREYYDPRDGTGCGGANFSWTAATALHWLL